MTIFTPPRKKYLIILIILTIIIVSSVSIWWFLNLEYQPSNGLSYYPEQDEEEQTKTYRNTEYGFEFQYPEDWTIKENAFGSAVSIFNLVVEPTDTAHLPRPIRINVLPNDWIERVQKSFEVDGIESLDVQIDGVDGVRYNHADEGLPQIDYILPLGANRIVIGGKKEYKEVLEGLLDTFKFLK